MITQLLDRIWHRHPPVRQAKHLVFGHNSHWGLRWFGDDNDVWATCLDDSRKRVLTALDFETGKLYQEPYEEK